MMVKKLCQIKKECVYFSIVKMNNIRNSIVYSLFIFCTTLICQGCTTQSAFSEEKPTNLIDEEKMKKIMSEMMLLETAVQLKYTDVLESKKIINHSGNKLLKSYGEDSLTYTQSFNYYASNKEQMKEMYNEILEEYNVSLSKIN